MVSVPKHSRPCPVLLLHGLGRTSASMSWLSWLLRTAGFKTHLLGYPSTRQSLNENTAHVRDRLQSISNGTAMDLVGHSMGGVIARKLCIETNGLQIRRVVQIGAPNLGSALADRLGPFWAVRKACGPSIADLRAHTDPLPRDSRIHAIAGIAGCNTGKGNLKGPNDGAVTVRSAWAGAGSRYSAKAMHTLLPVSNEVLRHVLHALTRDE